MITSVNLACMKIRLPGNITYCLLAACLLTLVSRLGAQGVYRFWGLTRQGGEHNSGTLFRLDSTGTQFTSSHQFLLSNPGASPYYTQLTAYNGKYYGVTVAGGSHNYGVIFEWDPATNVYTSKYNFSGDDVWFSYGSLTLLGNKFYGLANRGGNSGLGVLFEWDPATNVFTKKVHFDDASGHSPEGSLVVKSGKLYGMTRYGGVNFAGVIFEYDPATNTYTKKIDLDYATGSGPYGALTWKNGKFYGLTADGGSNGYGTIFSWDPVSNNYTTKFSFDGTRGKYPYGSLTLSNNKLYGMTTEGGSMDMGVLFEYDPAGGGVTAKVDFNGSNGRNPYGNLTATSGKLCGMTWMGGINNLGVLFEYDLTTSGLSRVTDFAQASNGSNPYGTLTWNGTSFYGLSTKGGSADAGVIFEWNPTNGNYQRKVDLNNAAGGALPEGNLVQAAGKLYGVTSKGGTSNKGILFEYDERTATFVTKINFDGSNGALPTGDLVWLDGKIYGWTREGGANDKGTIFSWDPATNTLTKKVDFSNSNGSYPARMPLLYNGKFYGTTSYGGQYEAGVLYEWDPVANSYTKKYEFEDQDGANPAGYLAVRGGKLYGMTTFGGVNSTGVIYEWNPATSAYAKKYDFEVTGMGVHPRAGLTLSRTGDTFYGMTRETNGNISFPGQEGPGVIFEWNPSTNLYTKKLDFDGSNGGLPTGNLTESGGKYYGMTNQGGNGPSFPGINYIVGGSGVVFEWDPATNGCIKKLDFAGTNGAYPTGNDLQRSQVPVAKGLPGSCVAYNAVVIDNTNNNRWVSITDADGNVVAEIKANGNNLGTVTAQVYVNNTNVREDSKHRLYLDRNITITPQVQPATPVELRLYITAGELQALKQASNSLGQPSGVVGIADIGAYKNNDGCSAAVSSLESLQLTGGESWNTDYVLRTTISSFSSFYFANKTQAEAPLPVQFISFTGRLNGADVLLDWKTASETNVKHYEVQRSVDGINYQSIGIVEAANTSGTHQYSYKDKNVSDLGYLRVYYRLSEIDNDNHFSYSKEVSISIPNQPNSIVFYPNPVAGQGQMRIIVSRGEKMQWRLFDNTGRIIKQATANLVTGTNSVPVNLGGLAAGVYYIELKGETINKRIRLMKE